MTQISSRARARARRESDPLFRREMRERWRRPLTLLQLLVFSSALAWLGYNIYFTLVPQGEFIGVDSLNGLGRDFFFALAQWHALAWIPGGMLLAAPALAAERERGHLTDWILAGLTPAGIVRAKFRALAGFVLVMVCVPFPIFALCFPLGGVSPLDFAAVWALTVAIALNSVAVGTMISANSPTVTKALASALIIIVAALVFIAPVVSITFSGSWLGTLILALGVIWLPKVWIAAAKSTFAVEVERHIKHDAGLAITAPIVEPRRTPVTEHGQIVPPTRASEPALPTRLAVARPMEIAPFSQLESLILRAAQGNAIAHRDVKRRFIGRRAGAFFSASDDANIRLIFWVVLWIVAGLIALGMSRATPEGGLFRLFTFLVLTTAMGTVALGAAPGFTRERAQKMLSALQMTALSPLDIVWGKVMGVLLLCAQYFGGPLLALCVMALSFGPLSALMLGVFGVSCVVFTATGSLTLSLWSRKTEIVALGALASIAALWWVLPTLYINNSFSLFFYAPRWLEVLWLAPIRAILEPASDRRMAWALAQLSAICVTGALVAGGLCVNQLRRTRADGEATGLLQRDLSRGWR